MPVFYHVNYKGVGVIARNAGVAKRIQREAVKYANFNVAIHWHMFMLPRHFEKRARQRYGYQKRGKQYSEIKRRLAAGGKVFDAKDKVFVRTRVVKGGEVDLAFGGAAERKSEKNFRVSATYSGFTLKMRVPKYIVMRRRGSYPNMKREIGMTTAKEGRVLKQVFMQHYQNFIDANKVT